MGHVGVADELAHDGKIRQRKEEHFHGDADVKLFLAQHGRPVAEAEQAAHVDEGHWRGGAADLEQTIFDELRQLQIADDQHERERDAADGGIDEIFPVEMAFAARCGEIEPVGPEKALVDDGNEGAVDAAVGRAHRKHQRQSDEADVAENEDGLENIGAIRRQPQQTCENGEDHDERAIEHSHHEEHRQIGGELIAAGAVHHIGEDHDRQQQLHDEGGEAVEKLAGGDFLFRGDVADEHHQEKGNELFENDEKGIHVQSTFTENQRSYYSIFFRAKTTPRRTSRW